MADGSRRFPPPWRADKIAGGFVVRDANGQALAYIYSRENEAGGAPGEGAERGDDVAYPVSKTSKFRQLLMRMHVGWIILVFLFVGAVIYGLDRGIYIGTTERVTTSQYSVGAGVNAEERVYTVFYKNCLYLFISGIVELPARGGPHTQLPGQRFLEDPETLYCRIFGE